MLFIDVLYDLDIPAGRGAAKLEVFSFLLNRRKDRIPENVRRFVRLRDPAGFRKNRQPKQHPDPVTVKIIPHLAVKDRVCSPSDNDLLRLNPRRNMFDFLYDLFRLGVCRVPRAGEYLQDILHHMFFISIRVF